MLLVHSCSYSHVRDPYPGLSVSLKSIYRIPLPRKDSKPKCIARALFTARISMCETDIEKLNIFLAESSMHARYKA